MASDLARRAAQLADVGRHADALALSRQALLEDPEEVAALIVLTQSLIRLQRCPEAYEAGNRLLAAAPDSGLPHRLLSIVYQRIGTPEQAYAAAVGSTRVDPFDALNHVQVAMTAHDMVGRRPEALAAAQHAVHLDPQLADAHFAVGYTARDRATQEAAYRRTLALDPDHSGAANNLTVLRGRRTFTPLRDLVSGYLGVLGKDPTYETSRANLVGLAYVFARRCYWSGVLLAVVALAEAAITDTSSRWSWVRALTGLVGVVGLTGYAASVLRLLGPGPRAFLLRAVRSERSLLVVALQAAGVVSAALVALLTPWVPVALTLVLFLSYLNLPLSLWSRRAHRRRNRSR